MLALFYIERVLRNNRDALGQYTDHEDVKRLEAASAGLKLWSEQNITFSRMPRRLQARAVALARLRRHTSSAQLAAF